MDVSDLPAAEILADRCSRIATEAAQTVLRLRESGTVEHRLKDHGELVTQADLVSDARVKRRVRE